MPKTCSSYPPTFPYSQHVVVPCSPWPNESTPMVISSMVLLIPLFFCYPKGCAAPGEVLCQCNTRGSLSKLKRTPPQTKINVTSKSPVGDISVVTLIRTDTTLDHSQKAEKVWAWVSGNPEGPQVAQATRRVQPFIHASSVGAFRCLGFDCVRPTWGQKPL